jgi:hypothetical protein
MNGMENDVQYLSLIPPRLSIDTNTELASLRSTSDDGRSLGSIGERIIINEVYIDMYVVYVYIYTCISRFCFSLLYIRYLLLFSEVDYYTLLIEMSDYTCIFVLFSCWSVAFVAIYLT